MARNTYYFPHDYDTRADEKILGLLAELGWEGYGLFWAIVETLYQNGGRMRTHYDRIAYALRTDQEKVKQIVECYGLFQIEDGDFWSDSILRRLEEREIRSTKARESALKRWKDANALPPQSDSNALKERKEKERKEKELFDAFWNAFHSTTGMLKTDKDSAFNHWGKLTDAEKEKASANILPYFNSLSDPQYCKKARTYLDDKNFNDEFGKRQITEMPQPAISVTPMV